MGKKKTIIILVVIAAVIGAVFAWKKYKKPKEDTRSVYEALVQVVDQQASNPDEDKRSSLKHGDVIAILPEGHPWTDTEKTGYLIVKIKLTAEDAAKLTEPVTREIQTSSAPSKGEEGMKEMETVCPRKYYLDIDVPTVNELMTKGQPYKDKIFERGVIEER